jgi:hypothetical protein
MEEQNPWWKREKDKTYEEWEEAEVRWVPSIVQKFTLRPFSLHFLVGPRQIGKTTALKIFIHKLLEDGREPKSIFYFACDELADYKELGEVLDNYLTAKKEWKIRSSLLILDEITFVEDWWRSIKARVDRRVFEKDVVIVTGSTSIEVLKEKERFPGRRGYGKDIYFYPLDFNEYVKIFGKVEPKSCLIKELNKIEICTKANRIFSETLSGLFSRYLETGGFPLPIRDAFTEGRFSIKTIKLYLDWLKNDWMKMGKSERYMKEVIRFILKARLSPVSWINIARETSINSPHTTQSYVEVLENLLCAKVLNIISPDFKILYRKNKKIHITDPFIYKVFSYYTRQEVLTENIVESAVVSHLSRVVDTFFWRNSSEIDVIALIDNKQIGFEVKWGFRSYRKPRHIRKIFSLNKTNLPLFFSSIKWA